MLRIGSERVQRMHVSRQVAHKRRGVSRTILRHTLHHVNMPHRRRAFRAVRPTPPEHVWCAAILGHHRAAITEWLTFSTTSWSLTQWTGAGSVSAPTNSPFSFLLTNTRKTHRFFGSRISLPTYTESSVSLVAPAMS